MWFGWQVMKIERVKQLWHLKKLKLDDSATKRIVLDKSKDAVLNAISNPRKINQSLVDAQLARRIDRLVGYKISQFYGEKLREDYLLKGAVSCIEINCRKREGNK